MEKKRFSLTMPALKEPYDIRNRYPVNYKNDMESEMQQWHNLLKITTETVEGLKETLNGTEDLTVKLDINEVLDEKSLREHFNHSLYYDYINAVENFTKKVICAVEQRKLEKERHDQKMRILLKKTTLIDKLIEDDVQKYF